MPDRTVFIISVKQVRTNASHCHWLYIDSLKSDRSAALECRIPSLLMETRVVSYDTSFAYVIFFKKQYILNCKKGKKWRHDRVICVYFVVSLCRIGEFWFRVIPTKAYSSDVFRLLKGTV